MKYKVVTIGGTFAYLHKGHRKILRQAFAVGEKVVVGVTSDSFMKRPAFHEGFVERRREVERFLKQERLMERAKIVKIEDMFGPLKENFQFSPPPADNFQFPIQAMVVSKQTWENADKINRWRNERGLTELDIVEVEMELAEDGIPISSRRILSGEINGEGVVYRRHKLWGRLPRKMREELRSPLGKVYQETDTQISRTLSLISRSPDNLTIAIGDISTKRLIEAGIKPDIAVFDLKVRRQKVFERPEDIGVGKEYKLVKLKNRAGGVSRELWNFFKDSPFKFKRTVLLKLAVWIEGEEDLAALPAVLFAPLRATVVYGQPPILKSSSELFRSTVNSRQSTVDPKKSTDFFIEGLVVVEVTEEKKETVFDILQRFER